ncbi:MAG: response regulator [Lachnospiraceae bacterium]|nr:response regulator [Lachnospiraceae bacterium]
MSGSAFTAPRARVLLADDNEMNLKVAVGLLEPLHMHIDVAVNGQEAYDLARKNHYDLIYMDQMMPVMDGPTSVKLIRGEDDQHLKEVPIVALTANTIPHAKDKCSDCGMTDFLEKPVKPDEIRDMTKKWLPAELIEDGGEAEEVQEAPVDDAPQVPGLSTEDGLKYSGSRDMWVSLLGDYYNMMDVKSQLIRDSITSGDIQRYTVEVHALKNTSRMIGAGELSQEFYELEQLGNARDMDGINAKTEGVLSHMASYKEALAPFAVTTTDKQAADPEEIRARLQELYDAMDTFDLDGADVAMKELDSYEVPDGIKGKIDRLRAYVADVAMEDVMSLAQEIIKEL